MKALFKLLLLIGCIFLYIACEDNNQLYNPDIENATKLSVEYSRLSNLINTQLNAVEIATEIKEFNTAYDIFSADWSKINVLITKAEILLERSVDLSDERNRIEATLERMLNDKEEWAEQEKMLKQLKKNGTELLLAFNKLKLSIFNPNYSYNYVESISDQYAILSKNENLDNVAIISGRSDFELIMAYGRDIRSIRKTYNFARVTSRAALQRTTPLLLSTQVDSVRLTFDMMDEEKDNKFFYEVFLEPHNEFTSTGDKFDFDYLYLMGSNIQSIYKLINAYTELSIIFADFENNYEVFDTTTTYNYDEYLNEINNIENAEQLFDSVYSNDFSNYSEKVLFYTENEAIKNWVHKFIDFEDRVELMFEKYKMADTITASADVEEILNLKGQHNWLYQQFEINEVMYDYLLGDYIYNIINEFDNSTVIYKFTVLQQKTGAENV